MRKMRAAAAFVGQQRRDRRICDREWLGQKGDGDFAPVRPEPSKSLATIVRLGKRPGRKRRLRTTARSFRPVLLANPTDGAR